MNNLHRELSSPFPMRRGPIFVEEETAPRSKRYLAGRRVVDVRGPAGTGLSCC